MFAGYFQFHHNATTVVFCLLYVLIGN